MDRKHIKVKPDEVLMDIGQANMLQPVPSTSSSEKCTFEPEDVHKCFPPMLQTCTESNPESSFPSAFGISSPNTSVQNSMLSTPPSFHILPRKQYSKPRPFQRRLAGCKSRTASRPGSSFRSAFGISSPNTSVQNSMLSMPLSSHNLPRNQPPQTAGVGVNPEPPHRVALRQLLHKLRLPSSPQQQDQILAVLRSNPQLMAAFIKQRQQQVNYLPPNREQAMYMNVGGPTPENGSNQQNKFEPFQLESHTASSPGSSFPSTFEIASPSTSVQNSMLYRPSSYHNPSGEQPPAPHAPGTGMNLTPNHRETLQQLLQVLRLPSSQQKKEQILAILKSSPQLMAALLKYRQLQQQQQVNLPPNGEQAMYMNIGGPTLGNGSNQQSIIAPDVSAVRDPMGLSNQQDVQSESSMVESILQSIENLKISDIPLTNGILEESGDMTAANSDGNASLETNAQQIKQWYAEISPELREVLVKKTIDSIISPGSDGTPRLVQNMHDFESYVRKEECDIYEAANSKFEYYDLLSKMSIKIRKELVEKNQ